MSKNWASIPLGKVLKEREELPSSEDLVSGRVRIVSKIGFKEGKIELRDDGETKTKMILIRPGDLVVSGINAAKGAIAIYGEENEGLAAATIHYGSYIPDKNKVDVRYLWWLLRSQIFKDILLQHVPGGIKTELKANRFLPIPVPLPLLDEQRKILARIENLTNQIDEGKSIRKQALKEIDAFFKVILSKLVDQEENLGCLGHVLLGPPRNGWSVRCDGSVNGTAVLSLGAVTGYRYRRSEVKRTSLPVASEGHFWLKPQDLLITRSNTPELVGHAAIYDGTPSPCIYPDLMMRLDINIDQADKRFVWYWLQSGVVRDFIARKAKGTSPTMKKISQGIVMNIPFPSSFSVPDQKRIVSELDTLQIKIDALKLLQAETSNELNALLPSILDKAFKGKL